jgi:hypothetical protein
MFHVCQYISALVAPLGTFFIFNLFLKLFLEWIGKKTISESTHESCATEIAACIWGRQVYGRP